MSKLVSDNAENWQSQISTPRSSVFEQYMFDDDDSLMGGKHSLLNIWIGNFFEKFIRTLGDTLYETQELIHNLHLKI